MGAEDETGEVRFVHDLPQCCAESRLRLPRPAGVHFMVAGEDGGDDWLLGLDEWTVRVGVTWVGAEEDLVAALEGHHGLGPDVVDPEAVLAAHGVSLEWDGTAEVGHASLYVANLASDLNEACGRAQIRDGGDLMQAADEAASDLETLVEPLIARGDEGETWSADLVDQWPDVEALLSAVILLRSVRVTPVLRGHGLGAWAAARGIALFDQGSSLVATYAAPLDRGDGVSGYTDRHGDLTAEEDRQWRAEQERLAAHWARTLGLVPLRSDPHVLAWHSAYTNDAITSTLRWWAQ